MAILKTLYWDIETSPNVVLAWGASYKERLTYENILEERKIICICWKWKNQDKVYSAHWGKEQCDKKALEKFAKEARKADLLVAHNGNNFDLKWVKTRCLLHGVDFPAKPQTRDTLKRARGNFRFNSNRLDYIGQFLGVGEKMETGGFNLWKQVMKGEKKALTQMVEYCKEDCRLLERVDEKITRLTPVEVHAGVMNGQDKWTCPSCGSDEVHSNKKRATAAGTIKREMKCKSCNRHYTISNKSYMDYLKFKMNQ